MDTKRIELYDVVKAVLIILVILGHIQSAYPFTPLKSWIFVFHMPAFFILSGILYNAEKWNDKTRLFIISRIKTLLVPYAFLELFSGICQMILIGTDHINIKGIFYNMLTMNCNSSADWFLPTLFVAELFFHLVLKRAGKTMAIIFTILAFASVCFHPYNHWVIIISRCATAYAFLSIGHLLKDNIIASTRKLQSILLNIALLILTIIISVINGSVEIINCTYGNPIFYIVGALSGTYFVFSFCKLLHGHFLEYIGKNTITIMGTHQIVISVLLNKFELSCDNPIVSIFAFFLIIMVETVLIPVFNYICPVCIGKQRVRV